MDSAIPISKLRDVIIVEKANGNTIPKGTSLYCGCCGGRLGEVMNDIKLPCDSPELIKELADVSFTVSRLGLRHNSCGHTMFSFQQRWSFMLLKNYLEQSLKSE